MTTIFDFPFGEVYEYTPLVGMTPPSGIGKGTMVKVDGGTFQDKKYVYKWDGYHDGGEWEVYSKATGIHIGVLDPKTKKWHGKKGAVSGRTLFIVFPMLVRSKGTVFFGPILTECLSDDVPESGLRILDNQQNEKMLKQLEFFGIDFPRSLFWKFCIGNEVTEAHLQATLCQLSEDSKSRWGAVNGSH